MTDDKGGSSTPRGGKQGGDRRDGRPGGGDRNRDRRPGGKRGGPNKGGFGKGGPAKPARVETYETLRELTRGAGFRIDKYVLAEKKTHKPVRTEYRLIREGLPGPQSFARLVDAQTAATAPLPEPEPIPEETPVETAEAQATESETPAEGETPPEGETPTEGESAPSEGAPEA